MHLVRGRGRGRGRGRVRVRVRVRLGLGLGLGFRVRCTVAMPACSTTEISARRSRLCGGRASAKGTSTHSKSSVTPARSACSLA